MPLNRFPLGWLVVPRAAGKGVPAVTHTPTPPGWAVLTVLQRSVTRGGVVEAWHHRPVQPARAESAAQQHGSRCHMQVQPVCAGATAMTTLNREV